MNDFTKNDTVYSFMGEELVEIKVQGYLDDIRLCGETEDSNVTVYAVHCHKTKQEAINAMNIYLSTLKHEPR